MKTFPQKPTTLHEIARYSDFMKECIKSKENPIEASIRPLMEKSLRSVAPASHFIYRKKRCTIMINTIHSNNSRKKNPTVFGTAFLLSCCSVLVYSLRLISL